MGERKGSRAGTAASLKARTRQNEDHMPPLALGLTARYLGFNTPLKPLNNEEVERDLRHMEAFCNASTSYAQQYYIFANQNTKLVKENGKETYASLQPGLGNQARSGPAGGALAVMPLPVRIDPEEEQRLQTLRQKIQQCEAQREIFEGQYLSLRAHYISLSKKLKEKNEDVANRILFLQEQVQKRSKLVALQRVRLQIIRETRECLRYRETKSPSSSSSDAKERHADLHAVWVELDKEWKKAEETVDKSSGTSVSSGVCNWPASRIPKIPPGVPLLLSQLGKQPGHALAWGTCGAFGAKPDSLLWIKNQVPLSAPTTSKDLPSLRKKVEDLKQEIEKERELSQEFQTKCIERRKRNDELVSMMALLRSETEAVVARHNILLESDWAKNASLENYDGNTKHSNGKTPKKSTKRSAPSGKRALDESVVKEDDNENDGDDEGGEVDDDEDGLTASGKKTIDSNNDSSVRPKRRRV